VRQLDRLFGETSRSAGCIPQFAQMPNDARHLMFVLELSNEPAHKPSSLMRVRFELQTANDRKNLGKKIIYSITMPAKVAIVMAISIQFGA